MFDSESLEVFGLDRQKVVVLSASAGAAVGAVIDVGLGGSSLALGALTGGLVSGIASLAATRKNDTLRLSNSTVGEKQLVAGPVKNLDFAFVLLGRALDFLDMIAIRTHADRSVARVTPKSMNERLPRLSKLEQVNLTRILQKASRDM